MTNRKTIIKLISILTAAAVLITVVTSLFVGVYNKPVPEFTAEQTEETGGAENVLLLSALKEEGIGLSVVKAQPLALFTANDRVGETFVTQTVTATITPSTVVDKYVTWTIAWDTGAPLRNQDISEYLTLSGRPSAIRSRESCSSGSFTKPLILALLVSVF